MPSAILLVCMSTDTEKNVLSKVRSSKGVLEVFSVNGAYDLVVKVKTETFDLLRDCIAKIKQALPKTQNMVTMLVIEQRPSVESKLENKAHGWRGD